MKKAEIGKTTIAESENKLPKTRKQQALETLEKCREIYDSDESGLLEAGFWTDFMAEIEEQKREIEETVSDEY